MIFTTIETGKYIPNLYIFFKDLNGKFLPLLFVDMECKWIK